MSTNQQEYIALTSAGSNQVQNFTALLGNFNQAVKATETAEKSAGSATKGNAAYMESLEARLQGLRAEWQNLTTEGGVINNFIKLVLSAGTAILKFANNDVVKFTVKIAAFTAGIYLAVKAVVALSGALWSLALNNPVLLGIAAITAGAIGLSKAIKTDQERFDELKETLQETNDALSQTQSEYDSLASKAPTELTNAEKDRLEILKEQLEILREQKRIELEDLKDAYDTPTVTVTKKAPAGATETIGGGLGFRFVDTIEVQESVEDYIKTLGKLTDADDKAREAMAKHAQQLNEFREAGIYLNQSEQEFLRTYNSLVTANNLATESYKKYGNTIGNLVEKELNKLSKAYGNNKQALADFLKTQDAESISLLAAKQAAVDFINANGAKQVSINNTSKSLRQEIDAMIKETEVERARVSATLEAEAKIAGARAAAASGYSKGSEAYARTIGQYVTSAKLADSSYTNLTKSLSEMYGIRNALNIVEYKNTGIKEGNASATDKQTEAEQKLKDAISETTNALKEQSNILGQAADLMISRLDDEISALEAQKQTIQDANQALEDQIELEKALDALAKAKSRKVLTYSGGQFVYSADATAVNEAQQRVNEIRRQQAQQAQLDAIDERIDAIKAEQDTWRAVKNAYDEYLGAQQLGVSAEGDAWKTRIGQAKDFAQQYLTIMQTLAGVESGEISLSQGKSILAKSKGFASSLPASTAYKSLLEAPITSGIGSATSAFGEQTVVNQYFGDISLPNVTNSTQFIEELGNYQQYAAQAATKR